MSVLLAALCASSAFAAVQAQVTLTGKAFGAGYLKNCTVWLFPNSLLGLNIL
jgi:hypothetical protein